MLRKTIASALAIAALALAGAALAAPGGNGKGQGQGQGQSSGDPSCSISPNPVAVGGSYVISASGLPTDTTLNLMWTDPNGNTSGIALGSTASGSYAISESAASAGTWTYSFTGLIKQQNTTVYATCSAVVS